MVGSVNATALLVVGVIALWLVYVLPRVSHRRNILGQENARQLEATGASQRLIRSTASHDKHEKKGTAMDTPRVALGTSDEPRLLAAPTAYRATAGPDDGDPARAVKASPVPGRRPPAPRLVADGQRAAAGTTAAEAARRRDARRRQQRRQKHVLVVLTLVTVAVLAVAAASALPLWSAAIPAAVLALYIVALRRSELTRRRALAQHDDASQRGQKSQNSARAGRDRTDSEPSEARGTEAELDRPQDAEAGPAGSDPVHREDAPGDTEADAGAFGAILDPDAADDAPHRLDTTASRLWTPVPVPTPAYLLKDEAPRRTPSRSTLEAFESADVEDLEADDEQALAVDVLSDPMREPVEMQMAEAPAEPEPALDEKPAASDEGSAEVATETEATLSPADAEEAALAEDEDAREERIVAAAAVGFDLDAVLARRRA